MNRCACRARGEECIHRSPAARGSPRNQTVLPEQQTTELLPYQARDRRFRAYSPLRAGVVEGRRRARRIHLGRSSASAVTMQLVPLLCS